MVTAEAAEAPTSEEAAEAVTAEAAEAPVGAEAAEAVTAEAAEAPTSEEAAEAIAVNLLNRVIYSDVSKVRVNYFLLE